MRLKLKTIYASPTGTHDIGSVIDVTEKEGADLVDGGYADEIKSPSKKAAAEGAEKPLSQMNRAELDAHAAKLGIDTAGAGSKAEVIKLIEGASAPVDKPLDQMTHDELVALAAEKGVAVDGAPDDAAIIDLLKTALEAK